MRLANFPHRRDINRSLRAWQRPTHREWAIELSGRPICFNSDASAFITTRRPNAISEAQHHAP